MKHTTTHGGLRPRAFAIGSAASAGRCISSLAPPDRFLVGYTMIGRKGSSQVTNDHFWMVDEAIMVIPRLPRRFQNQLASSLCAWIFDATLTRLRLSTLGYSQCQDGWQSTNCLKCRLLSSAEKVSATSLATYSLFSYPRLRTVRCRTKMLLGLLDLESGHPCIEKAHLASTYGEEKPRTWL